MGDHLGVGRGLKLVPVFNEPLFEGAKVFDDAVVDDRDDPVAAQMRMGVQIRGGAVRGPAGVADADVPEGGRLLELGGQVVDPSGASW